MFLSSVEEQHVLTIINNLKDKSSYGHDGISNNLIKRIKDVLIKPLTINQPDAKFGTLPKSTEDIKGYPTVQKWGS